MLRESPENLVGNDRFEGFGIDLIKKLAEMEGFNYTFTVREDKANGVYDPDLKKWTGMIGDLLEMVTTWNRLISNTLHLIYILFIYLES